MKDFKAGKYVNQGYYKAFVPEPIHAAWEIEDMVADLEKAEVLDRVGILVF